MMLERTQRSWGLLAEAWAVLRENRELVLFPIFSGIATLLVMVSFFLPMVLSGSWGEIAHSHGAMQHAVGAGHYVWLFLFYLATYFVVVFFNSGLVACVRMRFAGAEPTVRDGLSFAMANIGRIFQWSLLSATVGTVLRIVEERAGWLGRIVSGLLGIAWSLATLFVTPVLVYEQVGPAEALQRSAETFRRTWGEAVVANVGLGLAFTLLFLGAIPAVVLVAVLGAMLMSTAPAAGLAVMLGAFGLGVVYWIGLGIVKNTLQSIFLTACYQYATTGEAPSAFSRQYIAEAWRPK
jgi:hypothetical protein